MTIFIVCLKKVFAIMNISHIEHQRSLRNSWSNPKLQLFGFKEGKHKHSLYVQCVWFFSDPKQTREHCTDT